MSAPLSPLHEQLLALLPGDGRRMPFAALFDRAAELGQKWSSTRSALVELCAVQRVIVDTIDGYSWARRVVPGIAPIVPRPERVRWKPRPRSVMEARR